MFAKDDIFINDGIAASYNRLNYRYEKLFEPVKDVFSNSIVVDIGSHNGRWGYVSLTLGAKKVIGIEKDEKVRGKSIKMLLKKGFTQDQFSFIKQDANSFDEKQFPNTDIVLCMGILYYLNNPIELLKKISLMKPKLAIIDTFQGPDKGGNVPETAVLEKHLGKYFSSVKNVVVYDAGHRVGFHCSCLDGNTLCEIKGTINISPSQAPQLPGDQL